MFHCFNAAFKLWLHYMWASLTVTQVLMLTLCCGGTEYLDLLLLPMGQAVHSSSPFRWFRGDFIKWKMKRKKGHTAHYHLFFICWKCSQHTAFRYDEANMSANSRLSAHPVDVICTLGAMFGSELLHSDYQQVNDLIWVSVLVSWIYHSCFAAAEKWW